jgi:hypothetical protein
VRVDQEKRFPCFGGGIPRVSHLEVRHRDVTREGAYHQDLGAAQKRQARATVPRHGQNAKNVQNAQNARNVQNARNARNAKNAKNASFVWSEECQQAFDRLNVLFTEAPILVHFHPEKPTVVETDASDFALGAVLSQIQSESSRLHPVAYYSQPRVLRNHQGAYSSTSSMGRASRRV